MLLIVITIARIQRVQNQLKEINIGKSLLHDNTITNRGITVTIQCLKESIMLKPAKFACIYYCIISLSGPLFFADHGNIHVVEINRIIPSISY